jgi:predicted TIM-barrel fold metal-dependent hydrolase
MQRIWDIHVHFPRNFQKPDEDPQAALDHMAERLRETGVVKASLLCPNTPPDPSRRVGGPPDDSRPDILPPHKTGQPRPVTAVAYPPVTHETCIVMAAKHGDLFVPHAVVDPQEHGEHRIHELHDMGYRGLKIIGTRRPYDDASFFPTYKAAEALGMPILFHCGVVGGGIDLLKSHPRRDPKSAKRLREQDEQARKEEAGEVPPGPMSRFRGPRETSAMYMRPFHLETLANRFPKLKIIGAHLGGTGNYDEAASVARWRRWVYFDVSGGRTIERHAVERGLIGQEIPLEKLIFGSDCAADEVHEHVERFQTIFADLGLTEEEQDLIWYRNAAELFGLEEPQWASE